MDTSSSKQLEIMIKKAKYNELKEDYKKIKIMLEMTNTLYNDNKKSLQIYLIHSLGETVCLMNYNRSYLEELNEIKSMVSEVKRYMNYNPRNEWYREWQCLWNDLEGIY